MNQKIRNLLCVFSVSVVCLSVSAQTDSIREKQIKEITVYSLAANSVALPYITVDKAKLQLKDFNSTADALQQETGISLSRDGMWATSVNVRGLSEQRLLFLVDNDRIQTATDIAGVLSTVNLNSLEKIEIIKGAASVLYGNGAMGGVVNFVTARPGYSDELRSDGQFTTGYQLVNNLWANNATVNVTNKDWYLSVNGSYRTARNTMTPSGVLANSQFHDGSWGLTGGMNYRENQELLVSYNHYQAWDAGLPGGNAFPSTATVRYLNFTRNQLSGEYIFTDLSDALTRLSIKAYTQNIGRDVENKVNATTMLFPSSINTTSGAKITGDLEFDSQNLLTVGAETWIRESQTIRYKIVTSATDTTVTGEQPTPRASVFDAGIFSYYKHEFIPSKLNLHAGLRADFLQTKNDTSFAEILKYKIDNGERIALTRNGAVLFLPANKPELAYSAHIDLEYMPTKLQKIMLSGATSYRAASIEERYKYINQAGGIVRKGNPNLKPEKGYFTNLSYSLTGKNLSLKADVFANYLFDLIAEQQTTPTLFVNTNVAEAFFTGAEVEFQWLISKQLRLMTNASYVRGRDVLASTYLPQIPPLHGFVSVNYLLEKLLETSLSAEWAAKQTEAATTETQTDGHIVFNWNVRAVPFKLTKKTHLQLTGGIDNILNTAYYNHLTSVRIGGLKYQEPGRNIYAKAQISW